MGIVRHFEGVFAGPDGELHTAVRVCIATNVFKLVLAGCVVFVLVPIAIFAAQFVCTLAGVLVGKSVAVLFNLARLLESIAPP